MTYIYTYNERGKKLEKRRIIKEKKMPVKKKKFVMDITEEEHQFLKMEAVKRNISMKALGMKGLMYFLKKFSK